MARKITKAEWKNYRKHGYASVIAGKRFVLALDRASGATVLEPVVIE